MLVKVHGREIKQQSKEVSHASDHLAAAGHCSGTTWMNKMSMATHCRRWVLFSHLFLATILNTIKEDFLHPALWSDLCPVASHLGHHDILHGWRLKVSNFTSGCT